MEFIETNWLLILIVLAAAIAIAWYIFHAARRTRVTGERRDVLDEGAAPAARNQALIDAPTAAVLDPPNPPSPPVASPMAGVAPPQSAVAHGDAGDDLSRIKGIGPKLIAQLHELGITRIGQIAAWDEREIDRIDSQLGRFQGRIRRDNWVEQAKLLAAGDETGFAGRFGAIS